IFVPIREFSGKLATIQQALASLDRIHGLLDERTEPDPEAGARSQLAGWRGALRIRGLRFRYRSEGPEVIKGIDLDVAPGEVVALVGRTGSGKSSLGRILTALYDGYEGS